MTGEQFSANLATAGRQLSGWMGGLPVKKLHNILCGVLILWVVYGLVQMVQVLMSPAQAPDNPAAAGTGVTAASGKSSVDLPALQALNLFGAAGAVPEPAVEAPPVVDEAEINAAKTHLKLSLQGIVYSPDAAESVAVIVSKGKQEQFHIGDKIPEGNNVTLARVLLDKVILDNNGKYESLWLYDEESEQARGPSPAPVARERNSRVSDMRDNGNITKMARNYRSQLFKNPASLAEVIRITPAQEGGQLVGYRINPGKDRKQFEAMGLKPNDIVTSINNIQLNEPSNALEIYKLMRTATQASFTINRNGQPMQIMVSLAGN